MFDPKCSMYLINNLDTEAIVYTDADGALIRLTRDMFASQEEFDHWKAWSDEEYHAEEKARHLFANHNVSLEGLADESVITVMSPEDCMIAAINEEERKELCRLLMTSLDTCLTTVQRQRLWFYYVDGLTLEDIAHIEGCALQNIHKSILAAIEKIKNFFQEQG